VAPALLTMVLTALVATAPAQEPAAAAEAGAAEAGGDVEGSVEVGYRSVRQDGSSRKYDEDFDGIDTGAFLHQLSVRFGELDAGVADFVRVDANGLGDRPSQRVAFGMGKKDVYDLTLSHRRHTFLYDLFGLVDDTDGFAWDSDRELTALDLEWHAAERGEVFFGFEQARRDGDSVFMKDLERELFRLDAPLDETVRRYSVGARFELGRVALLVRQMLQESDHDIHNRTRANAGLDPANPAALAEYDWRQDDEGTAHLTTLTVSSPVGRRVHVTATMFGTLLGDQEITSDVGLEAAGTSFLGAPFVLTNGTSRARIEADHLLLDGDLSVRVRDDLDVHLQLRSLDREVRGAHERDLDGNGAADDTEGAFNDAVPGSRTRSDWKHRSITGLVDWAASPKVRVRAGYRTIDRELERSGFELDLSDTRNASFESDDDDTIVAGLVLHPVKWLRMNADWEDGDVARAFTATSPTERTHLRALARFTIRPEMQLSLAHTAFENTTRGADFRLSPSCSTPGSDIDDGCWNSDAEGRTYSASFSHRVGPELGYWLAWTRRDLDSNVRVLFDTDDFFVVDRGWSLWQSDSSMWSGRIDWAWSEPWTSFAGFRVSDSDGDEDFQGQTFATRERIDQTLTDVEVGLTRTLRKGVYVGGRFRTFEYDDDQDRLDYDGEMLTAVVGATF
jgi:hypothetical protein